MSSPTPSEMLNETNNSKEALPNSTQNEQPTPLGSGSTEPMAQVYSALEVIKRRISANGVQEPMAMAPKLPIQLLEALKEIIGEYNFLWADPCIHGKILNTLKFHFQNDVGLAEKFGGAASDIENLIQYHPAEVVADKAAQIFSYLCIGDVGKALKELENLKVLFNNAFMELHFKMEDGFLFIAKTLELFVYMMNGTGTQNVIFTEEDKKQKRPCFKTLSTAGRVAVKVVKTHFFRTFHYNSTLRINILKEVRYFDGTFDLVVRIINLEPFFVRLTCQKPEIKRGFCLEIKQGFF